MVEEVLKFKRLDGAAAALRKIADANFSGGKQRGSLRDRLAELKMPVQVIWGDARPHPAREACRGLAAEREGDAHRRRRPHPAHGEGGGGERRDQGFGLKGHLPAAFGQSSGRKARLRVAPQKTLALAVALEWHSIDPAPSGEARIPGEILDFASNFASSILPSSASAAARMRCEPSLCVDSWLRVSAESP